MAADGGWVCTQHEYVFESFGFALVVPGIVAGFDMFSENGKVVGHPSFLLGFLLLQMYYMGVVSVHTIHRVS